MRIITWNCNMAFRKKWAKIMVFQPDILVLQECEHPSKYKASQIIPTVNEFLWFGENEHKGVGILSFNNYHIKRARNYNPTFKYIIPIKVTGEQKIDLFAIWAMPDKKKANSYVGQIWNALQYYKLSTRKPTILIGDFNSNAQWDNSRKIGNHSQVVELLRQNKIESIYHLSTQEIPSEETKPTIYLLKKLAKPFHLDYCFASTKLINDSTAIQVGDYEEWIEWSDHLPLIIDGLGS
ncbi:MAG: endonuclease/exonuclease/phosphatase family protein [Saprospiraceae bacterium]